MQPSVREPAPSPLAGIGPRPACCRPAGIGCSTHRRCGRTDLATDHCRGSRHHRRQHHRNSIAPDRHAVRGVVILAGSLSIIVLPLLGTVIGMTPAKFGTWVGGAVHDITQTVATASTNGDEALPAAIVVKLTRVALLAPVVVGVALARRRSTSVENASRPPLLPLLSPPFY